MHVPVGGAGWMAVRAAAVVACCLSAAVPAAEPVAGAAPLVRVQRGDGTATSGRLLGIDAGQVRLASDAAGGAAVAVPVEGVRSLVREDAAADGFHKILVTLVDGATLSGDEFAWDGKGAAELVRPEGRIELPVARVRSVAVLPGAAAAAAWQAAIPEGASSDLVVVGGEESHEFVECAITAVSPETVTVVLDEETIPVKRSKVIGMQWLRNDGGATAGRLAVSVAGGVLKGDRVEWSADGLVVDGEIRLPAALLTGVDYASGRTVGLAGLNAEKVSVEPWFGALARGAGLESFFAPRAVSARKTSGRQEQQAAAHAGLIMRPRTVATWRLPPDSRRLRATVAAAAGSQAADATIVAVAVDDRELFRRQVDATAAGEAAGVEGIPLDIDLAGGRRLTVTVDFGTAGGIGGAVLFADPVIER